MRSSQPDRRHKPTTRIASAATAAGGASRRTSTADRRRRERLRDLCDEVLASYRAATDGGAFPAADRAEAERLLARVAPLPRR
ncbi:MAG: hypothetical protein ACYC2G_13725 [Gemmatimonadaceae bacterium]